MKIKYITEPHPGNIYHVPTSHVYCDKCIVQKLCSLSAIFINVSFFNFAECIVMKRVAIEHYDMKIEPTVIILAGVLWHIWVLLCIVLNNSQPLLAWFRNIGWGSIIAGWYWWGVDDCRSVEYGCMGKLLSMNWFEQSFSCTYHHLHCTLPLLTLFDFYLTCTFWLNYCTAHGVSHNSCY